ncbi:hypothetical protein E3V33_03900 [Candidatus Marinimicrobia bacterium MT.SAG.4]|nr:hypothetical protein E3V33_03900 [Candidatus Marinimicrobia bacterium MT.SAG.4]
MINLKLYDKKLSPYFDAVIAVLAVLFIAVLFVPQSLWSEEDALREECRIRMENLYELEIEFYRLVNRFPESPEEALKIVQMALDSVNADTSFYGAETLRVDTMIYAIDTQGDLAARVDTLMNRPISEELFSCPFVHERYTVDIANNRTIYIACPIRQELNPFKITLVESDDSLRSLFAEVIKEKNYEMRLLASIHEVLPLQKEWRPELIIIDDRTINDETLGIVDQLFDYDEDVLVILMMQMEPAHTESMSDSADSTEMIDSLLVADSTAISDSSAMAMDSVGAADDTNMIEIEEIAEVAEKVVRRLPIVSGTVPYSFTLGDLKDKIDESVLISPRRWLREDYYKRRYLVFTMVDSIHGFIDDGDRSWQSDDR